MAQHRTSGAKDLVITCIKGDGIFLKFWALPVNALDTIKNLESHFLKIKSELDSSCGFLRSEQIPIGFKCAVKSQIKGNKWCRARILDIQGFSSVVVQLMDYGNEEIVSVQHVRNVDDQILSIAPQAIECILADVIPARGSEWSVDAINFCEQHLLFNKLSCYVVSECMKLPVVRVAKKGENEAFVQRLINSGLALIKQETPTPPPLSYKMNGMDINTSHLVKVSCVENAYKFYVQLSAVEMELKHLMDSINRLPRESLTPLKVPVINSPCLALLSSKQCFYRALITMIQQNRCKVFFVDYGFSELKEIQDLRVISPSFMQLPAQAICCSLPKETTIDIDEFKRLINYEHLECCVLSRTPDSYVVKLFGRGQDLKLISRCQGLLPSETYSYMQQKLNPGAKCEVTVSYVNDLKEFYCQLTHFKEQQSAISTILNSGYNFIPISLPECSLGRPVCVKFSEDNLWYRAQIVNVNHENDIEVFFVDFGNYDNVNLSDVKNIGPDALQFPTQAYKCYLYETLIPTDSKARDDVFDMFEELTTDKCLLAHVHLVSGDSGYGITLYSKNSSVTINEKLQSTFLTVPSVPVKDTEKVFVTTFESASCFFAQFEKLDSDKLSQMQDEINTFYSGVESVSFIPKVGSLVCAKFDEDEQFYRARVDSIKDGFCNVFFIDYGNKQTISVKDVYALDVSFTKCPQFGTSCGFENCPSEIPSDKLSSLMLDSSIRLKFIRKDGDKWYVSLEENCPENAALLDLFKQDDKVMPRSIHGAGLGGYQENKKIQSQRSDTEFNKVGHFNDRPEPKKYQQNEVYPKKRESPPKTESAIEEFKDYSIISIPPKACRHVYVSHVLSPSEFYCQIEEESSKLQLLMKTIEDIYATINDSLKFTNFVVDAPCCAIYEDGAWYRGKIKKIVGDSCDVFFVDYGNISTVSKSEIKVLRSDLFRWPSQAICCKSYNISPKGKDWNEDEINAFINMTLDKSFVAQFVDCDKNGVYAVNLVSIGKLENDIFNKEFVNLGFGRLQDPCKSLVLNSHAASNNLSFTPLPIEVGSSEPVEVTFGLNPGEIFCQLKSYAKNFKDMMLNLQDYYSKVSEEESLIDRPHQGMICVAQFFLDFAWYRAEIKKVEANKIVVFYADYGNSETVDRKKVRCIIQDYTSLPVQAVKCRIRGIKPPGKTWTINENLSKYFEGSAICKFISKENDYFLVDISCNQKDVAQSLITDGLAVSDSSIEPKVEIPVENKVHITQQILPERKDSFVCGQLLSVIVSYIENPSRFWCQLLDELDILDELMAEIGNKVSEFLPLNFSNSTVGSYCLALYAEDETWYRAQIKSFEPENNVYVFFIDYGNCEMVSKSQVKALPLEFTKHPALCFACCLQNTPSKLLPEMTTLFRSTVEEVEEITAKVENFSSNYCTVSLLFDRDDQELNVSELLFGVKEDVAPPQFLPPDVPLGLHEGYVSTVNSPQDFYVQLSVSEDALADLSSELATASETLPGVKEIDLCIGYACSSKYSEDNNWYRAEVLNILDSTVDVLFVDYGNIDTVPKDSLINLTEKHLQLPPLAIKCKLNGIVPAADEWSEEAINTFQDMVLESCLGITFISKDIPATVNIAKDDKDIAQSLVDIELANFESCAETDEAYAEDHLAPPPTEDPLSSLPNDQSYPERKLSSTKLVVKICYVDSYDKFYVTPLDLSTELDTVMTTLNILYASNENSSEDSKSSVPDVLEDPKVSMPCVAKYSEDEAWYRAVITEVDGENIYVTFVDYGNSEITSLQNLRFLTPELVKIPPIAMECSLYGIEAVPGQEQQITAKLEEYYVEEHEIEMEICEFSPYKIRLNYNGDIATMFIKEGLAKEQEVLAVECEAFVNNSKMTFVDESLEYRTQISKRFFNGVDKIVGNVKFCEIENDLIVFHVVSADLDDELQGLQQKLQDAYSEAPGNLANAACMDFCATKYVEDENWYRAQVLSCDKDKVKVRFIDYGNCETVDRSDLYELLHEFTVAPQFSVKCILFGLKVNKSKEVELQDTLDELVYHDHVEFTLCKNAHAVCDLCILNVVCLASDCDTNILELILKEQLVSHQYIVNTGLDVRFEATVEQIESDVIYLLPSNLVQERDAFQNKLQHICQDLNVVSSEVQAHFLYAAKIEDNWHRVSIIDTSSNDISVYLVDFGLTKVVSVSDLVLLPTDICHQPLFLYPCIIKAFNDLSGDVKEIDIQSLEIGKVVTCQLKKTYPLVHPFIIRILEIVGNAQSIVTCSDSKLNEELAPEIDTESIDEGNNKIDLASHEQNTKVIEAVDMHDAEGNKLDKSVTEVQKDIKTEFEEVELSKLDDKEFHESEILKPSDEVHESQEAELKNDERTSEGGLTDLNEIRDNDNKFEELTFDENKIVIENESAINQDSQNSSEEVGEIYEKESLDTDFESNENNKDSVLTENDVVFDEKLVEKEPDASNQDESIIPKCNNEEELEKNETKLSEDNKSDPEASTIECTEEEVIQVKENEQFSDENMAERSDKEYYMEGVLENEQFSKDENIDEMSDKKYDVEQILENEQFSKDENKDEMSDKEYDMERVLEKEQFSKDENIAEISEKKCDMEQVLENEQFSKDDNIDEMSDKEYDMERVLENEQFSKDENIAEISDKKCDMEQVLENEQFSKDDNIDEMSDKEYDMERVLGNEQFSKDENIAEISEKKCDMEQVLENEQFSKDDNIDEMSDKEYDMERVLENEQLSKDENIAEISDKEYDMERVLENEQFSKDENIAEISDKKCDMEQVLENEQFSKDENIAEISDKKCDMEQVLENEQFSKDDNIDEMSDKKSDVEQVLEKEQFSKDENIAEISEKKCDMEQVLENEQFSKDDNIDEMSDKKSDVEQVLENEQVSKDENIAEISDKKCDVEQVLENKQFSKDDNIDEMSDKKSDVEQVLENEQVSKDENIAEISDKKCDVEQVLENEQFSKDENIAGISEKKCDVEQVLENDQFSKDDNIDEMSDKKSDVEQILEKEQFSKDENIAEISDKKSDVEQVLENEQFSKDDSIDEMSDKKSDVEQILEKEQFSKDENEAEVSDKGYDMERVVSAVSSSADLNETNKDIENIKSHGDEAGDVKTEDMNVNFEKDIVNNQDENIDGIRDMVNSSNDAVKENNRGIEDSYHLSGSVQVKISEILINDGSVIFAVQPLYLEEEFSLLKQSMQDFYSSAGTAYDKTYSFCVVFFENEWCRGEVLQNNEECSTVMLVDYGKYVPKIDSSNVKNIESEHSNIPPFAVWCTLSSVFCPLEKTETAKTFLYDKLKNCHALVKILEGGKLYKINILFDGSSVINMLLKSSLVTQRLPSMDLEPGSYRAKLSFLNINSKTVEIFITLSSFSSDYLSLHEIMQTSYKLEDSITNVVESGIYAAYYNNSWHRGSVISSGNDIQVFLIDTGEVVSGCKNLCFLLPEHCLQPAYAIPCHIPFTDVDATNEIFESISNVLKAADFLVNIEICSETNTISATVIDELIVSEVKNMGLSCNIPTLENNETENLDNISSCSNDTKSLLLDSSSVSAVVVQQQETSEHLVGYLEETFTTESS